MGDSEAEQDLAAGAGLGALAVGGLGAEGFGVGGGEVGQVFLAEDGFSAGDEGGGGGNYSRSSSSSSSTASFDQRQSGPDDYAHAGEITDDDIPF